MKTKIQIRTWTGGVLFEHEAEDNTIKKTIEAAVKGKVCLSGAYLWREDLSGVDLSGANLSGADLRNAYLWKANLSEANFTKANLSWADLSKADLSKANLSGADLSKANLFEANLSEANFTFANLSWADLSKADLSGVDLSGVDLSRADYVWTSLWKANLDPIKHDLWAVLSAVPAEVEGLRSAIIEGRIEGSTYQGKCACLVGTIANVRGVNYKNLGSLKPDSYRPAERFFVAIKKGDTPETSQLSKLALEWIDEWLGNVKAAFSKEEKIVSERR